MRFVLALLLSACAAQPIGALPGPPDVVLEADTPPPEMLDRLVIATSPVVEWRAGAWRVQK